MPLNHETSFEPVFDQHISILKKKKHYKTEVGATLTATDEKLLLGVLEDVPNNPYWFGRRIFILSSKDGEEFLFESSPSFGQLPPTSSAPSLTSFQNRFIIVFTSTRSTDYPDVVPQRQPTGLPGVRYDILNGGTPTPTEIPWIDGGYEGKITVYKSNDGSVWRDPIKSGYSSRSSPDISTVTGSPSTFVLNWRRARADEVYVRFSDGSRWYGDHQVTHHRTGTGPAIGSIDNRLVTAFKGRTNNYIHICINSIDTGWSNNMRLVDKTDSKPALQLHNNRLYLAWLEEGRISLRRTSDGLNWSGKFITDATSVSFPDLTSYRGELYCSWLDFTTLNIYTGVIPI